MISFYLCVFDLTNILCFHRAPIFAEDVPGAEGADGELVKPIERSFWAKYVSIQHTCWLDL